MPETSAVQRILFVTSEAHPLMKTGGLGDVCGSLPRALAERGNDVRLLLPAYRDSVARAGPLRRVAELAFPPLTHPVVLLEGRLPGSRIKTWLIDYPPAFDRGGNPYLDAHGQEWPDNAARFALLARVAVRIARNTAGLSWQPHLVHAHDWQTGLVPALLSLSTPRPATLFTVHNLAYQGLFPASMHAALQLPDSLWSLDGLEFHGQLSFIKGGLAYADAITTVSPNYAREIQTAEFGCGLDGLLRHRQKHLYGILNGIDDKTWNPARDPLLVKRYSARALAGKAENKTALQREFSLPEAPHTPLLGMVGRLVEQKGVDLVLAILPRLLKQDVQLVVLGGGDIRFEQALQHVAESARRQIAVHIGYNEALAHRIEAGADLFLMPSRFEPCGLNQLYSLRYGTVPVVHRVGGLADSVVDATPEHLASNRATGLMFDAPDAESLLLAVVRGLRLYREPQTWRALQRAGMTQDFSWAHSAADYQRLYDSLAPLTAPARV